MHARLFTEFYRSAWLCCQVPSPPGSSPSQAKSTGSVPQWSLS
jgi:hypothetical protein